MATLINYPTGKVKPDCLLRPGDDYQAYGLAHAVQPVSLCFVQPDGSMACFPTPGSA